MPFVTSGPDPFPMGEVPPSFSGYSQLLGRSEVSSVISAPSTTKTVIVAGQSNVATAIGTATYTTVSASAHMLNPYDGGIYAISDPALGCQWAGAGVGPTSIIGRFADRVIAQGKATRVIMIPVAIGGTLYAQWAQGGVFYSRLTTAILRARARGLEPSAIIWGQGETDNVALTSAASITASIFSTVDGIRAAPISCNAPVYIGYFTMNAGATSATIRTGITNSIDAGRIIRAGYDADTNATVAGSFRLADSTHLSATGATLVANGYADLVFP